MARKAGLGRGLDALFADAAPISEEQQAENTKSKKAAADLSKAEETPESTDRDRVLYIDINDIKPNSAQPRSVFDEEKLKELAGSIKANGVIQPLIVREGKTGYELVAGERRWRASRIAGLRKIPCIVRDFDDRQNAIVAIIENMQREDLNPIEEVEAYKRLMDEFRLGQAEVAARVSKSRSAVANSLRLLKLEERVRKMVVDGQLSMGHARAILPVEDADQQYELAQKITEKQLSVRETEKIVKEMLKSGAEQDKSIVKIEKQEEDPSIAIIYKQIEERLQQSLHTKVSIQRKRNGHGKLQIDFYNSDDLEKIIDRLTDR